MFFKSELLGLSVQSLGSVILSFGVMQKDHCLNLHVLPAKDLD